jgi:glycosyltransferase involved in cell wall biosynthesis
MQTHEPEIGYLLKGYPRTSETFITNEIYLLEQAGLKISIFSLKTLEGQQRHGVVSKIQAPVTYLPETTPQEESGLLGWLWLNVPSFAASHWKLFRLRPAAYLGTLAEALGMCLKYRIRSFIKEFLQAGFIALKVLESGRIRHLHAHFCHTSTTVAMLASRLAGVAFSFTAHAKDIYREDMNPGDLLQVKLSRTRFAVTCTGANQVYLDRLRPPQIPLHKIYHGLDLSVFIPSNNTGENTRPLILSVGRMVEKKGFTYLVEACRLLRDARYDFVCRIVGGADQYTETIKRSIEQLNLREFVSLHSAVTQEELRRIYEQATVFALPCQVIENGDRDGIPNVLVEAMAMELPVVSTDISGIPELVEHRVNGLLVPQKDAQALASAIKELLDDAELRKRLSRSARETVRRDFDAKQNILALKSLFDSCLNQKSAVTEQTDDFANYSKNHI